MPKIVNVNLRNNYNGYLVDAEAVKGGYVAVEGTEGHKKEDLPSATVVEGTLVYDATEGKSYRYKNNAWVEVAEGGGSGEPDQYIKDATFEDRELTLTKKDDSTVVVPIPEVENVEWIVKEDTGDITLQMANAKRYMLSALSGITKIDINIPNDVQPGFMAEVTFRGYVAEDKVTVNTDKELKFTQFARTVSAPEHSYNAYVTYLFEYNGVFMTCYVTEIQDSYTDRS